MHHLHANRRNQQSHVDPCIVNRSRIAMPYRRNLFAVTAATFIGFMGFTLVMPFLPLYFRQLGVNDVGESRCGRD